MPSKALTMSKPQPTTDNRQLTTSRRSTLPTLKEEKKLWKAGFRLVAGVDEVGRGAWAGPIVAAAIIFPPKVKLPKCLNDSKKLTPKIRQQLSGEIKALAKDYHLALLDNNWINHRGLSKANNEVLRMALVGLKTLDFALIDFFELKGWLQEKQRSYVRGDERVASIAAASILAKVYRDELMINYGKVYGEYGFDKNKGYGTNRHQKAIRRFGITPIHRLNFIPEDLLSLPRSC